MPTLLITSFGPWGSHRENASTLWWERAQWAAPEGWTVVRRILPVDWTAAPERLFEAIEAHPDLAVVALCGLAESRQSITPERFARNRASAITPDIQGLQYAGERIRPDGPATLEATLPFEELVNGLRSNGIPSEESHDAGDYLCNYLSYRLLDHLQHHPGIRGGFIHVPPRDALTNEQWQTAAEATLCTLTNPRPTLD